MPSLTAPVTVRTIGPGGLAGTNGATMMSGSQIGQIIEAPRVEMMMAPVTAVPATMSAPIIRSAGLVQEGGDMRQLLAENRELKAQMTGVLIELAACKARLDKLDPPETPLRAETRIVENRGNVKVNHQTGHVQLLRPIGFQPRTTKEEPTAVFRDPDLALSICKDIAEISNIFRCPMTIEGHTKGGESDFWQTLANRRASLVADKMVEFGANANLLETRGLPGRLGKNEVRTEIHMDVRNIKDESAAVQEVDVVVGGRVVERDFVQAGRVVERDQIKMAVAVETDVIGNQIVSRQVYAPVVERDFVGESGGKALERSFVAPTYARPVVYQS